jgi:hypothetical protein
MSHHVWCFLRVMTLLKWLVVTKTHAISHHFTSIFATTTTNIPTNHHQPREIYPCNYRNMSHHVWCCLGVRTLLKWSVVTNTHTISHHFTSIFATTTTIISINHHQPRQMYPCSYGNMSHHVWCCLGVMTLLNGA